MSDQILDVTQEFARRHIGPNHAEVEEMLNALNHETLDQLCEAVVPDSIKLQQDLDLEQGLSEAEALAAIKALGQKNKVFKSWIGQGFSDCITPAVIRRNILENPGWYTQYTPYQPEISQGRLEALLNFQTMITDLTGMEVANASLLDESTAAAEAMALAHGANNKDGSKAFFVSEGNHIQTIEVLKGRAEALGIDLIIGDHTRFNFDSAVFGVLLAYPSTTGAVSDYKEFVNKAKENASLVCVCADLLALTLLTPPGEWGADVVVGSSQRFGVPMGYGGPHAAYMATKDAFKRRLPGRIVGASIDKDGKLAYRLALQTREQHIRREKATSNICTAQALLANMAGMYAVYHGKEGLEHIALRIHHLSKLLQAGLVKAGFSQENQSFFDTLCVSSPTQSADALVDKALKEGINLRAVDKERICISFDETTTVDDVKQLLDILTPIDWDKQNNWQQLSQAVAQGLNCLDALKRTSSFLEHSVFKLYRSETELMRYIKRLEEKDLSLTSSMIPLGSCTMKLNAACELEPLSNPAFGSLHPFCPTDQAKGYLELFSELETMLAKVTGYDSVSLQPNSGAQGEYAGLLVIKAYHKSMNQDHRNICLIPSSAHGTNPASAAMAGYKVVSVRCDQDGNIDLSDLSEKAIKHKDALAALMLTYPSTHGVFEVHVKQVCQIIHDHGGQVYLDGANLNAQLGLCSPGDMGADVSHLNLHKTFAIPHGGGGPGMGPIAVKSHLADFLPGHPIVKTGGKQAITAISESPWGSASILTISWMYMKMMGATGLKRATQVAILNANYIVSRLQGHYDILYRGEGGYVAHECIIDIRPFKSLAGIDVMDIAKRLMDYGFHAPTVAFPVAGTLMIEPTESENKAEIDRFCDAMISIRKEIKNIEDDIASKKHDNPLKNAPHSVECLLNEEWTHSYSRQEAVFPAGLTARKKYWPPVGRINDAFGDRNFCCVCSSDEE